jgi:hypothetical protein
MLLRGVCVLCVGVCVLLFVVEKKRMSCRAKKGCRCAVRGRVMVELLFEWLLVVVRGMKKIQEGK